MLFGRFEEIRDAVPGLLSILHEQNWSPRLIRVEGKDGVGKSRLSKALAPEMRASLVQVDKGFRFSPEGWSTFIETVRVDEFQREVQTALEAGYWVVADSVCLNEVLPEERFGRGFRIYVMQVEPYYDGFLEWPYGADLEREPIGYNDIDLSIRDYHLAFKPHCRADAVIWNLFRP